jgi:type IV secretory pathway VirJ component
VSRRGRFALAGAVLAVALLALGIRALRGSALAGEGAPGVEDLPLVELPARAATGDPSAPGGMMAVVMSGDGGWVGVSRSLGGALARQGIPTVGWNSLRYYRTPRTPQEAAEDLQRVLDTYGAAWGRPRVLLVGYSFGADALPFLVSRLPAEARARVAGIAVVAMGRDAAFEFHFRDWISRETTQFRVVPEVRGLGRVPLLCVYGARDRETKVACPLLRDTGARIVRLPGGHYFRDAQSRVNRTVLEFAASLDPAAR